MVNFMNKHIFVVNNPEPPKASDFIKGLMALVAFVLFISLGALIVVLMSIKW